MSIVDRIRYEKRRRNVAEMIGCTAKSMDKSDELAVGTILTPELIGNPSVNSGVIAQCDAVLLASYVNRFLCVRGVTSAEKAELFTKIYVGRIQKSLSCVYGLGSETASLMLSDRYSFYDSALEKAEDSDRIDSVDAVLTAFQMVLKRANELLMTSTVDIVYSRREHVLDDDAESFCTSVIELFARNICETTKIINEDDFWYLVNKGRLRESRDN